MSEKYNGMRWLKCDLQVQTPEDARHWYDNDLKLLEPRRPRIGNDYDENHIQDIARKFLRRCYELELDLIGITDHNFSMKTDFRDWFIYHLIKQNKTISKEFCRAPIIILPGFEADIGYHVLCLFEPTKNEDGLKVCDTVLTTLGLDSQSRFENGLPSKLIRNRQNITLQELHETVQKYNGIIVAAHADTDNGILNSSTFRKDFLFEDLLCVEITQNPPSEGIKNKLSGKDQLWKRKHGKQPAFIMSSDAKSIKADLEGNPNPNSLGYRHSWIKMSNPSIESLRQAFLDNQSRIHLPLDVLNDKNPIERYRFPRLTSIKIQNVKYLEDQVLHFSPNLNCLIGGRGSGKSTVIEYLKVLFQQHTNNNNSVQEKAKRILDTLEPNTSLIEVNMTSMEGVLTTISYQNQQWSMNENVASIESFIKDLPIKIFSQQEINKLSSNLFDGSSSVSINLLPLIREFNKYELEKLEYQEKICSQELRRLLDIERHLNILAIEKNQAIDKLAFLEKRINAYKEIEIDYKDFQLINYQSSYYGSMPDVARGVNNNQISDLENIADSIISSHISYSQEHTNDFSDFFKTYDSKVLEAKKQLKARINEAITEYYNTIDNYNYSDEANKQITAFGTKSSNNIERFKLACSRVGLDTNTFGEINSLNNQAAEQRDLLKRLEESIDQFNEDLKDFDDKIANLNRVWHEQYQKYQKAVEKINLNVRLNDTTQKFINVSIQEQRDFVSFKNIWGILKPQDGRKRLAQQFDDIGTKIYQLFISQENFTSPWYFLRDKLFISNSNIEEIDNSILSELKTHILDNPSQWDKVLTSRVNDLIDIKLYRADGNLAGKMSDNSLSDGQKNTVILGLLLAQENLILVIDQPEDELDSSFIYNEMIPMIRKMKNKRQIIFATHNANIPVNGDSELVYALHSKNNKGHLLADGGLDNNDVKNAVLNIMEGSEEAFRKRREKYNF